MSSDQFHLWLSEHKRYFPLLQPWLGRLGMNLQGVMGIWIKCLESIELEDARSASAKLFELEAQPRSFDRHPVEIKRLAKAAAVRSGRHVEAERTDGAVKCKRCKDVGMITVFYLRKVDRDDDGAVIQVRELFEPGLIVAHVLDEGNERDLRGACVRCDCGSGEQWTCHPPWRESMLISKWCAAERKAERFWEKALKSLGAPGANSTTTFNQLATAGMGAF